MFSSSTTETSSHPIFFGSSSRLFYFFILLAVLIFCFLLSFPLATAADTPLPDSLISNESLVLRDGDVFHFQQGYEVVLRRFGASDVLIEFYNNNTNASISYFIGSMALKEGETIQCYRRTESGVNIVFTMMLSNIYLDNSKNIAEFSQVYQYTDPDAGRYLDSSEWILYKDVLTPPSPNGPGDIKNDNKKQQDEPASDPLYTILIIAGLSVVFILFAVFYSRKRK